MYDDKNIFERELKLPFEFKPEFDRRLNKPHLNFTLKTENQEFIDWLNSKDIAITHGERFYLTPIRNTYLPIHVDVFLPEQSDDIVKINFVYCEKDTYINWYKLKEGVELETIPTSVNSFYKVVDRNDADLVYTVKTDRPRLINAGIPHDVYPPVTAHRYSFSFILIKKSTGIKLSWNQALEILSDCIVN